MEKKKQPKYDLSRSYVYSKIDHLRRVGLVTGQSVGLGINGGACPDWLADEQLKKKEEEKKK